MPTWTCSSSPKPSKRRRGGNPPLAGRLPAAVQFPAAELLYRTPIFQNCLGRTIFAGHGLPRLRGVERNLRPGRRRSPNRRPVASPAGPPLVFGPPSLRRREAGALGWHPPRAGGSRRGRRGAGRFRRRVGSGRGGGGAARGEARRREPSRGLLSGALRYQILRVRDLRPAAEDA